MCDSKLSLGVQNVSEENRREPTAETVRIAERLHKLRRQRGVSQLDVCERLGITQSMMSRYENGSRRIPSELLLQFAKIIGVSSDEILGLKPIQQRSQPELSDEMKALWQKFQQVSKLQENDQRAVIRLINSVAKAKLRAS